MMLKPGDKVAVLDEDLEGKVLSVSGGEVEIETSEGFLLSFQETDLVKLGSGLPHILPPDVNDLSKVIKEKESSKKRRSVRVKPKERTSPPMEVDLHIHKLVPKSGGLSNYEILSIQTDTAKRQLEFAMRKRIQKVVFIHGVGEGVLRAELETLFNRYENLKYYDADYQKYGLGATEVYIFQNY
ncbi:Smr/MutS family protein [Salinimicrobium oceani]|uniref:DNA mismatch repair protein MutS n=1 Tax=Salinimicrobium oceani TaxID=2722702 RepID=A0ABX1D526_9FLAO|nr:Smr/MutS family protein [Salinimicrobium oceani]NJW54121.1 DNA mismatch repair protein MutS [Salinimicrobium oceani]